MEFPIMNTNNPSVVILFLLIAAVTLMIVPILLLLANFTVFNAIALGLVTFFLLVIIVVGIYGRRKLFKPLQRNDTK